MPSEEKLCHMIGHIPPIGVVSLCISLPIEGPQKLYKNTQFQSINQWNRDILHLANLVFANRGVEVFNILLTPTFSPGLVL